MSTIGIVSRPAYVNTPVISPATNAIAQTAQDSGNTASTVLSLSADSLERLSKATKSATDTAADLVSGTGSAIDSAINSVEEGISNLAGDAVSMVEDSWTGLEHAASSVVNTLGRAESSVASTLGDAGSAIGNAVSETFSGIGSAASGAVAYAAMGANAIQRTISEFI